MSRRSRAQRKVVQPDPIYNSRLVTLLISRILKSGKKSLAQKIVYNALELISTKTEENPILNYIFIIKDKKLAFNANLRSINNNYNEIFTKNIILKCIGNND